MPSILLKALQFSTSVSSLLLIAFAPNVWKDIKPNLPLFWLVDRVKFRRMGKGLKNLPKQVEILRKKWHMWLKEEKIFFSQTLNLKPEQQYTRDPVEHCLGQKLKFILMMTSGDFDNDKSRFCYERSRFSWWQVKILLRTVEIFMMTGRDNFFCSWYYSRKQGCCVSLRFSRFCC